MRKPFAAIGILAGGYFGWSFGSGLDRFLSEMTEALPGHLQSILFGVGFAALGGLGFLRAATALTRKTPRVIEVEKKEAIASRVSTGRTPPAPRPAFQL